MLWYCVRNHRNVVYHSAESDRTVVIERDPNDPNLLHISSAMILNADCIPCLDDKNTIFIFDAKAKSNSEPPITEAFLIETASRNIVNYAQTIRSGVGRYCIPSYTVTELLVFVHDLEYRRNKL